MSRKKKDYSAENTGFIRAKQRAASVLSEIGDERARQLAVEGWNEAHDDKHSKGELAQAAACYADPKPSMKSRGSRRIPSTAAALAVGR